MKKIILSSALAFVSFFSALAQTPTQRNCGTMQHHQYMKQTRPNYQAEFDQYNLMIDQYIANNALAKGNNPASPPIITIPVVVHVVYNTPAENISNAQAISQVQVLNDDFAKLNADAIKVTQSFSNVASGAAIRFCLAQRDPAGNPTTGVVHYSTTVASFGTNDAVKATATGGAPAWDVTRYMNIWICDLTGTLLGYGEFPTASLSNTWGLVIDYAYAGSGGSATAPFNLGRTGTHEFGHCFNLFHIWGDDGNACTGSDQCSDTPNQGAEHYGCFPAGSIQTDACSPSAPGTMWMNYMDYTDDACMYMFTAQQVLRMEAVVNTAPWNVLATSNGCTPVSALDASISSILKPVNGLSTCSNSVTPQAVLFNAGTTTITSALIQYKMDATATQTLNWTGSLAGGASTTLTLNAYTGLTNAAHTFSVWCSLPNGTPDPSTSNDSKLSTFTITSAPVGATLPFTEGFEGATFPPTNWLLQKANTLNAANSWTRVLNSTGIPVVPTSSAVARMDNYSGNVNITGQLDALRTPALSFVGANSSLNVTFDVSHKKYDATTSDSLNVYISTDCGGTWTWLYGKGDKKAPLLLTAAGTGTAAYTPTATAQWRRETVSLSAYVGQPSVYLKFESHSGWGQHLYLDNINVTYTTASVAPVSSFSISSPKCVGSPITFTDLSTNSPTSWTWTTTGGTPATSNAQNPSITYNTAGVFTATLIAANASGTSTPVTQTFTVLAKPTVAVTSASVCAGNTATLTASGASTYSWNTGSTGATFTASPTSNTTYTVIGTATSGCTNQAVRTITAVALPTVAATSTAICVGSAGVLTASGASSYSWSSGATTASTSLSPTITTSYTVTGTASTGCKNTAVGTISVNALPVVTVNSATVCSGNPSILTASGASTYSWSTGASTASISVNPGVPTNYTVTGTASTGCKNTAVSSVAVNTTPTVTATSATTCAGSSVTISASGASTYSWSTGATGSALTVSPSSNTTYTVIGTSVGGCTNSAVRTITVISLPTVAATSTAICIGNNGVLTASGASTYSWNTGATTASLSASPAITTTYTVTGTAATGCKNTATGVITVNNLPTVSANSATICSGSTATLTATGANTYVWNTTATSANISVSPVVNTGYTVTGTSAQGCVNTATAFVTVGSAPAISVNSSTICSGQTATLTATGVTSYTWSNSSNASSISVNPTATTIYSVSGNLVGCATNASQTATVTVNSLPIVSMSPISILCINSPAEMLMATPAGGNFTGTGVNTNMFDPSVSGAGSFQVTYSYTDVNGCSDVAVQNANVNTCTGLASISNSALALYPNPTKDLITLNFNDLNIANAMIQVYDATGKLVMIQKVSDSITTLSMTQLATGIYSLRVISSEYQIIKHVVKE